MREEARGIFFSPLMSSGPEGGDVLSNIGGICASICPSIGLSINPFIHHLVVYSPFSIYGSLSMDIWIHVRRTHEKAESRLSATKAHFLETALMHGQVVDGEGPHQRRRRIVRLIHKRTTAGIYRPARHVVAERRRRPEI